MMDHIRYILIDHFDLALDSALLMATGLFISIPVVKYRLHFLQWIPLLMMRLVMRLFGRSHHLSRTALVIWLFNSSVMFIYMAGGFHPLLPKVFGIWTGMNIGVVMGGSHGEAHADGQRFPQPTSADAWRPPRALAVICGLLVLLLELPCFFYTIALGMRMGAEVAWGGVPYTEALPLRAAAYGTVIVPTLLISAFAEAVAIRAGLPEENNR